MAKRSNKLVISLLAFLSAMALVIALVPESIAATNTATPSPYPRASSSPRTWATPSATPRPVSSSTTAPVPTPTPTVSVPPLTAVYADTNVPQVVSIEAEKSYTDNLLTISFLIKARIHRNTIQSLALTFKPKISQNAPVDPIFQAPCTKISDISISSVTTDGNSTALQKRVQSSDWYLEEYVIQSKTKISKNLGPCAGSYLITGLSFVDAAKHTFTLDANLASTFVPTSTTAAKQPTTPTKSINTDTAIMQSNIWNSRPELAPCSAGTNLAPTLTSVVIQGKTTQAYVAPTILNTNRVACPPTIGFTITNPLFGISEGEYANGEPSSDSLKIIDYAAELTRVSGELSKLTNEMAALSAQNAQLMGEIALLKNPVVVTPTPKPTPKPSASSSKKPSTATTKKPTAKVTKKSTPWPQRQGSGGKSNWNSRKSPTPTAKK